MKKLFSSLRTFMLAATALIVSGVSAQITSIPASWDFENGSVAPFVGSADGVAVVNGNESTTKVFGVVNGSATASFAVGEEAGAYTIGNGEEVTVAFKMFNGWLGAGKSITVSLLNSDGVSLASISYNCNNMNFSEVSFAGTQATDFSPFGGQSWSDSAGKNANGFDKNVFAGTDASNPFVTIKAKDNGEVSLNVVYEHAGIDNTYKAKLEGVKMDLATIKIENPNGNGNRASHFDNLSITVSQAPAPRTDPYIKKAEFNVENEQTIDLDDPEFTGIKLAVEAVNLPTVGAYLVYQGGVHLYDLDDPEGKYQFCNVQGVAVSSEEITIVPADKLAKGKRYKVVIASERLYVHNYFDMMQEVCYFDVDSVMFYTAEDTLQAPEVAIEESEGVYTVTSTSADAALYYLCKPTSWLDEGETPESCLQAEIEGMGSMIDSEETWDLYDHMGMKPAPKTFTVADYQEVYAGEEMFIIAANVGWDGEKLGVISNIEKINFTVPALPVIAEGTYYIQNVESGLFMSGANSWGTQASATVNGDPCFVGVADGGYTITGASLTSASKTLGYNLFVDTNVSQNGNTWTIAPVEGEEGVYTIYGKGKKDNTEDAFEGYIAQSETAGPVIGYVLEAVSSVTDAAKWRFITKEQAVASIKSGDNISFLFENPNFTRNHATSAWIVDEGCTKKNLGAGENNNFCAESYHSIFNIHQTITGVPNGTYSMTVQGFYRNDFKDGATHETPVIYVNNDTVKFPSITEGGVAEKDADHSSQIDEVWCPNSMTQASHLFTQGLYTIDPIQFEVTDGTITIGVKNDEAEYWCIWDNFQVTYLGDEAPAEIAVTLVANDSVEYLLNTHSVVTIDQPISAIKVAGLDQVQDSVTYAIYGMDKAALAAGLLSVNTIGYAEFAPVTLYEGNQYNVVVTAGENTIFDQIVIGAAEPAEIEIAATINDSIALNTHSAISAEAIKSIEVSFDGFAPTQAGFSINTLVEVAGDSTSTWEVDSTLAQGVLSLNGKGYVELDEEITLNAGTKYCVIINADNQSATFEINGTYSVSELAVTLVANDSVEYLLNTHSVVTIDQPISAIKVAGLDQVMDSVTYAIYGMDKATLAAGLLSVNTIGYAEFAPVTLYEGNQYNVVVTVGEETLFDQIVIGAAEPAEIEIAATINDSIALNTHSAISAESIKAIEVSFDGFAPTQAGYSINTLVEVADSAAEASTWEIGETLAQGELSLNGKGYVELEEEIVLNAGTKYCVIINADNQSATFEINGAYVPEIAVENEQTPAVDALDGLTFVITDVNGVNTLTVCHTSHPNVGEQDMFSFNLNEYNGDQYVYCKFAKVADNKYTIQMHNAAAEYYALWNEHGYMNFQTPGKNVVFALGLNGDQLGQDGENCGVWEIAAVEGGYTMKNVGNGGYYNPAVAAPSAEPVVVKFWKNMKGEENAAIVGINSIATASKANGKYIENGKVVIVKNGVKYNVAGSIIK